MRTLTDATKELIDKLNLIHGNKYDYSNIGSINTKKKHTITCKEHGDFKIKLSKHLDGKGCPKCATAGLSPEEYIEECSAVHSNKYDYSKADYKNNKDKITISCPNHGEFDQVAGTHKSGSGCPQCATGGYKEAKSGLLYYVKVKIRNKIAYKIGITNRTVNTRFSGNDKSCKITQLGAWKFENGAIPKAIEKSVLQLFKNHQYKGKSLLKNGNTEMFNIDILELDGLNRTTIKPKNATNFLNAPECASGIISLLTQPYEELFSV